MRENTPQPSGCERSSGVQNAEWKSPWCVFPGFDTGTPAAAAEGYSPFLCCICCCEHVKCCCLPLLESANLPFHHCGDLGLKVSSHVIDVILVEPDQSGSSSWLDQRYSVSTSSAGGHSSWFLSWSLSWTFCPGSSLRPAAYLGCDPSWTRIFAVYSPQPVVRTKFMPAVGYALDVLLHVLFPAVGYALLFFCTCWSLFTRCGSALFYPLWVRSFLPAVGPLFSTRCGSALFYPLWVRSFTSCRSALSASFHSGSSICSRSTQASGLSCVRTPASLFCECVCLAPRAPYTPSFAVWCLGLSRACAVLLRSSWHSMSR